MALRWQFKASTCHPMHATMGERRPIAFRNVAEILGRKLIIRAELLTAQAETRREVMALRGDHDRPRSI
jgi:hypothetical protein